MTRDAAVAGGARCYASLLVYPGSLPPVDVTARLQIQPTTTQEASGTKPAGWFLSSQQQVNSDQLNDHIDWILDRLEGKAQELEGMRAIGARTEVSVYWFSPNGHGGPTLGPTRMLALGQLGLECWFDVYCM